MCVMTMCRLRHGLDSAVWLCAQVSDFLMRVKSRRFPSIEKDMKMVLAHCGSLLLDPASLCQARRAEAESQPTAFDVPAVAPSAWVSGMPKSLLKARVTCLISACGRN